MHIFTISYHLVRTSFSSIIDLRMWKSSDFALHILKNDWKQNVSKNLYLDFLHREMFCTAQEVYLNCDTYHNHKVNAKKEGHLFLCSRLNYTHRLFYLFFIWHDSLNLIKCSDTTLCNDANKLTAGQRQCTCKITLQLAINTNFYEQQVHDMSW